MPDYSEVWVIFCLHSLLSSYKVTLVSVKFTHNLALLSAQRLDRYGGNVMRKNFLLFGVFAFFIFANFVSAENVGNNKVSGTDQTKLSGAISDQNQQPRPKNEPDKSNTQNRKDSKADNKKNKESNKSKEKQQVQSNNQFNSVPESHSPESEETENISKPKHPTKNAKQQDIPEKEPANEVTPVEAKVKLPDISDTCEDVQNFDHVPRDTGTTKLLKGTFAWLMIFSGIALIIWVTSKNRGLDKVFLKKK